MSGDEEVGSSSNPDADSPYYSHVKAIRERPWDMQAIQMFVSWLDECDPPRAELVRMQMEIISPDFDESRRGELEQKISDLINQNRIRWTRSLDPLGWRAELAMFEIGLINWLYIQGLTDDQAEILQKTPEIRALELDGPQLSESGYQCVCSMPQLDELIIRAERLTEQELEYLEQLPPWTVVELYCDGLEPEQIHEMNMRRIAKWRTLDTEGKRSAGARFLLSHACKPLRYGQPIKTADLRQTGIRNTELQMLSGLPELEKVDISEGEITSEGLVSLTGLKRLKWLRLWSTCVTSIAPLAGWTHLEHLEIYPHYDITMGDEGFAGLETLTGLKELFVREYTLSDVTVLRLAPLKRLRQLDLSIGDLNSEDCLSVLSELTELESLYFRCNTKLSERVLDYLSGLKQLQSLSLHIDQGDGDGFQHLAGLEDLEFLEVGGNAFNNRAIQYLAPLKNLKTINAQGSAVTKSGARKLAEQLPDVTIILNNALVKTPRKTITCHRCVIHDNASVLVPASWTGTSNHASYYLNVREDGWDKILSWSGQLRPLEFNFYYDSECHTANAALKAFIHHVGGEGLKIIRENVHSFENVRETASCIFEKELAMYFVITGEADAGVVVFVCEVSSSRFAELEPLFLSMARSVRLGSDPALHQAEIVEIPVQERMG